MADDVLAVEVRVEFTKDLETDDWVVRSLDEPRLSARDFNIRTARQLLIRALERALNRPVRVTEQFALKPDLAERVENYHRNLAELARAKADLARRFMPLVTKLLRIRLQQRQVAELVRMSPAQLSQLLHRQAADGSVDDT